ncbi:MAG: hypothetical protein Kow0026_03310 [Oricola sp.]
MGTREAQGRSSHADVRPPSGGAGIAGSLAIHLTVLLTVLFAVPKPAPPPPTERRVSVEIVNPGEFAAAAGRFAASLPPPRLPEGPSLPAGPPDIISFPADLPLPPHSDERIVPARLLSAATLADPRSADALAALPQLAADERAVQLCSIEALAQIAALDAEFAPDLLAAYATGAIRLAGPSVEADGAAFRSRGQWYALAFKCALNAELDAVAAFEFTIGKAIPHEQWAGHNLAEGADPHGH